MTKYSYKVIEASGIDYASKLQRAVHYYLCQGWRLQGGVFVEVHRDEVGNKEVTYYQAITKESDV